MTLIIIIVLLLFGINILVIFRNINKDKKEQQKAIKERQEVEEEQQKAEDLIIKEAFETHYEKFGIPFILGEVCDTDKLFFYILTNISPNPIQAVEVELQLENNFGEYIDSFVISTSHIENPILSGQTIWIHWYQSQLYTDLNKYLSDKHIYDHVRLKNNDIIVKRIQFVDGTIWNGKL